MKKIFTSPDPLIIKFLAGYLENANIGTNIRGEDRMSVSGGLAPIDCWLELWIVRDEQEDEALKLIEIYYQRDPKDNNFWNCPKCGERLSTKFTECWKCTLNPDSNVAMSVLVSWKVLFQALILITMLLHLTYRKFITLGIAHWPLEKIHQLNTINHGVQILNQGASLVPYDLHQAFQICFWLVFIGLFFFINIARYMVLFLYMYYILSPSFLWAVRLETSTHFGYYMVNTFLGGVIISLAFWSPIAQLFSRKHNNTIEGSDKSSAH